MDKLSMHEHQKLISILKEYKHYFTSIEEKAVDIIESITFEAKSKKSDIRKAKINLINASNSPEIGVTFENN